MKKSLIFCISLFLFVFLLSGCENEFKTMTCTKTTNQNNTKMSLNYEVDYKGNYVTKVKSVEIVKSDDSEYLNTLKEQTENIYSAYNNIEYPKRLASCLLQRDGDALKKETVRFLTNSTIGLGGLFDPADRIFKTNQLTKTWSKLFANVR